MKKLILLLLFIPLVFFAQEGKYNPIDDVVTIEIPQNVDELRGYPTFDELDPEAITFFNLATELISSKPNQAIILFKKAINKDPYFVQAYDNLAKTYRELEEYDLAIKYYLLSQKIYPWGNSSFQNLAVVYTFQKDWSKAINQYEKLISLYPDDPEGYYGLANLYLKIETNLSKALSNAKKALTLYEINPPNYIGDSYAQVGLIYYYRGEKEFAKKYLKKAKAKYIENNLSNIFTKYESILNSL